MITDKIANNFNIQKNILLKNLVIEKLSSVLVYSTSFRGSFSPALKPSAVGQEFFTPTAPGSRQTLGRLGAPVFVQSVDDRR
jgi:hypothetical protein